MRLALLAVLVVAPCLPAFGAAGEMAAVAQMAADRGCYNCHGEPPRRSVPSLRGIAAAYAQHRGRLDAATEQELVDRLRKGSLFSHIAAHERLGDEDARRFVRWLVEGGPDAR
jgi:cytochrome c